MRKQIINQASPATHTGLDLEQLAQIEITSEDEAFPIESALTANKVEGWKAAQPGEQVIRIMFDTPQKIQRVHLLFREEEKERSQEFLLRWKPESDASYREIVRQQYNFSPPQTTEESEEYTVNLDAVSALELTINPDINGRGAYASLAQLQLI
ncbi:hypothetical protein [Pontibacter pamirensis]|uniref:hypothetical protein n=1 Tax=Pontibacter pamirensis TaxID=2562824 RepID=UPI001389931D|nr:hypothetical protein [Pontibacter pamirensis]